MKLFIVQFSFNHLQLHSSSAQIFSSASWFQILLVYVYILISETTFQAGTKPHAKFSCNDDEEIWIWFSSFELFVYVWREKRYRMRIAVRKLTRRFHYLISLTLQLPLSPGITLLKHEVEREQEINDSSLWSYVTNESMTLPCDPTWRISLWIFLVFLWDEWVSVPSLWSYVTIESMTLLVILRDEWVSDSSLWSYVTNESLNLSCAPTWRMNLWIFLVIVRNSFLVILRGEWMSDYSLWFYVTN
jgi:hypothetical protein